MRELVVENQEILIIPQNFRFANKGKVTEVRAGDFTLKLDYEPTGILRNTYCEFYTQTARGKLYFDSYAKLIDGKTLIVASPAKHKFLQRRRYTRIRFVNDLEISCGDKIYTVKTLDLSAGGMKFASSEKIDIEDVCNVELQLSDNTSVSCVFKPIRIEKHAQYGYLVSGQFEYSNNHDRMMITQFCAKRSVEIKNK